MFSVDPQTKNAPYSSELAQTAGWKECVDGLEIVFHDHPALEGEASTFYVKFDFMDGKPFSIGARVDPPNRYNRTHMGAPVDIFEILRESLVPMLAKDPIHHAMFRYNKNESWAVAGTFDETVDQWDKYRARRTQLNELRANWFAQHACPERFEDMSQINLEILFDPINGGRELEYRMYKPPTTIKQLHTNTLNKAIFISESAAVTYPQTV